MVHLRSVWHTTEKLTVFRGKSRPSIDARREPYRQLAYAAFVFEDKRRHRSLLPAAQSRCCLAVRRRVYTLWRPSSRHLSATKSDTLKYTSQTGQSVRSTATQQWLSQLLGAGLYIHQKPLKFASRQSARLRVSAGTTPAPASSRPVNSRQFIPSRRNVDKSRQQNSNPASESIQQQTGNNDNNKTNNGSGNDQGNTNATLPTAGNKPATATSAKSPKRAELRQQDDCPACNNRGFQIVDEELQPCTVCNGAAWEPAQPETFDLQAVPFEEPPNPSDETPRKGRQRKGGRPLSQAARDKIRATMKGRRWTEEHRRAISESMKGVHNAEHRSRISAAMTARPKVCSFCGEEGHNRRGCPKLHPDKVQSQKEAKTTSSKTVVVCSHCKSRGHSRRTCPQLQTTADSTTDSAVQPSQLPVQQDDLNQSGAITNGAGRTVRLFKGSLPSQQQSLAGVDDEPRDDDPVTDQAGNVESGSTACVVGSQDEAAEAGPLRSRCSYCGGTGHNARTCAKLAAARQEEDDVRNREKFGSLWGVPGVVEQPIRRGKETALIFPIPAQVEGAVSQAAAAVVRAYEAGMKRQRLELLLPQAGVTSAQGSWPGGIRQQAQVAIPSIIEPLLKQLKQHPNLQGRMGADWVDESDCVGAWQNSGLAAVLFPTAETLPQVRQIARVKGPHRLMLIINPQWQINGQVVSDFGFGKGRADAEKFLGALQDVYCLERVRILGDDLRLLKCYPGNWQVHYTWPNGRGSVLLGVEPSRPSYARLVELLKAVPNTRASRSWVDRVLDIKNLKGDAAESSSSSSQSSFPVAPAALQTPPAQSPDKQKGLSLRERMQEMLAEADNLAAVPSLDKTAHCQDGPLPQQTSGRVPLSMDNAVETRESASALPKPRKSTKGPATPADQSSKNATAAPDAVQKESEAEQKRQPQIRQKFEPGRLSKLSTDQAYSDDTLDRFGSVDGKPTRDLKLDPVLQFVKWRESILGSRDFVSESKDVDSLDQDNE